MMEKAWGMALSGGGIRAAAHIGVLQALHEFQLRPAVVAGTSGGAIIAALYAAGMEPDTMEAVFTAYQGRKRRRFLDWNWLGWIGRVVLQTPWRGAGLIIGRALEAQIQAQLPGHYTLADLGQAAAEQGNARLLIHAVDLHDGRETLFCDTKTASALRTDSQGIYRGYRIVTGSSTARAVRASCSIPGIFLPARIGGQLYIDGGVRQGYPLRALLEAGGVESVLGVQLGYAGERQNGAHQWGITEVLGQSLDIMTLHQYRTDKDPRRWDQQRAVTLLPEIYDTSLFDTNAVPALIQRGRQLALAYFARQGLDKSYPSTKNRQLLFPSKPGLREFSENNPAGGQGRQSQRSYDAS